MMNQTAEVFHRPALLHETIEFLQPRSGTLVDCCIGGGGHARAILDVLGSGRLLGIDADPEAISFARRQLRKYDNVELVHSNYCRMADIVEDLGFAPVTGVLMDLGVSLHQLRSPHRGFGYNVEGPLDMRLDPSASLPPALTLLRRASVPRLRQWLRDFGQEPFANRIARRINEHKHEIKTTKDLADVVRRCVPARRARKTLARVFQAFRIITNCELENVQKGIQVALDVLVPGGRLVVIAYHSLEDRLAKQALREGRNQGKVKVLTPKPVRPGIAEVLENPQARSARLRAGEVLS